MVKEVYDQRLANNLSALGIILFLSAFIFDAAVYDGQMNEKEIYCLINRRANHCMFDGLWKDNGKHSKAELSEMLDDGVHIKAIIYDHFRKDAEELHNDKCSRTFWGDIHLRLENATLVWLNTAKLALGTDEKALMREIEDSDDIVLERRLKIIRNKKGVNRNPAKSVLAGTLSKIASLRRST